MYCSCLILRKILYQSFISVMSRQYSKLNGRPEVNTRKSSIFMAVGFEPR